MESKSYIDKSTDYKVTGKDLNRVAIRTIMLNSSFNFERMQANGILYSLAPVLKKIHKNKEDLKTSMKLHLDFFNTHTYIVSFILGLIVAMEEKKEEPVLIRSTKVALMGPLAGIGDSLIWFTVLPILAGIGASMALENNILGPVLFFISFNIVENIIRFGLLHYSYKIGLTAIDKLHAFSSKLTRSASILGMVVIGALISAYVSLSMAVNIHAGKAVVNIQEDVIDTIMPNMLPLLYTLLMFHLIKRKKMSPISLIGISVVMGVAGAYIGLF